MTNVEYKELSKKLEEFKALDRKIEQLAGFKSWLLEAIETCTEIPIRCSGPCIGLELDLDASQAKLFYDLLNTYQELSEQKLKEL